MQQLEFLPFGFGCECGQAVVVKSAERCQPIKCPACGKSHGPFGNAPSLESLPKEDASLTESRPQGQRGIEKEWRAVRNVSDGRLKLLAEHGRYPFHAGVDQQSTRWYPHSTCARQFGTRELSTRLATVSPTIF